MRLLSGKNISNNFMQVKRSWMNDYNQISASQEKPFG
jgi:hypothetical protein